MDARTVVSSNVLDVGYGLGPVGKLTVKKGESLTLPEIQNTHTENVVGRDALFVRFKHGGVYRYDGVSYSTFDALSKAESVGTFMHSFIKDKYPCSKLEEDPFLLVSRAVNA